MLASTLRLGSRHAEPRRQRFGELEVGLGLAETALLEEHESAVLVDPELVAALAAVAEQPLADIELAPTPR